MHQYLKAIGFENIQTRKDLKKLLKEVEENFTHQTIVSYRPGEDFCEFQKEFGQDVGITLCGELDDEEHFEAAYYFPYFEGSGVTTYAEIDVQRKIEKEQYVGLCEDSKIGISLIFTLQNGVEQQDSHSLVAARQQEVLLLSQQWKTRQHIRTELITEQGLDLAEH